MIRVEIEIIGSQTETHCSATSSIGACEKLNVEIGKCRMYKRRLAYDWDAHAYKRCEECMEGEVKS